MCKLNNLRKFILLVSLSGEDYFPKIHCRKTRNDYNSKSNSVKTKKKWYIKNGQGKDKTVQETTTLRNIDIKTQMG